LNIITPDEVRRWFATAEDADIQELLNTGLDVAIEELEADDFFGTEGFCKRFA